MSTSNSFTSSMLSVSSSSSMLSVSSSSSQSSSSSLISSSSLSPSDRATTQIIRNIMDQNLGLIIRNLNAIVSGELEQLVEEEETAFSELEYPKERKSFLDESEQLPEEETLTSALDFLDKPGQLPEEETLTSALDFLDKPGQLPEEQTLTSALDFLDKPAQLPEEETPSSKPDPKGKKDSLRIKKRLWRTLEDESLILKKLEKANSLARKQAEEEHDNEKFKYMEAEQSFLALFNTKDAQGEKASISHTQEILGHQVTVCQIQGDRRSMEDEFLITHFQFDVGLKTHTVGLFGIFDGNGGVEVARYVKKELPNVLPIALKIFSTKYRPIPAIWNALKITFPLLSYKFAKEETSEGAGTTAEVMILLDNEQLWIGNVGDSRAFLDNGESLSEDATPLAPRYKTELENRGAEVYQTGYFTPLTLNVSRVIGYLRSSPEGFIVNSRAKIVFRNVKDLFKESDHIILMSDGVGRAASTRQLAQVVRKNKDKDLRSLAINVIHSAYRACLPTSDNLSMLILRWNKGDTQSTE